MEQTNTLRFFYNGIKGSDGKLQTCAYHAAQLIHYPAGTITIYARKPRHFSAEIGAALTIQNDSDSQTDYFECDRIRVQPDHPLYRKVSEALEKLKAHSAKRYIRHGLAVPAFR